jgi:hypothetical protein
MPGVMIGAAAPRRGGALGMAKAEGVAAEVGFAALTVGALVGWRR